MKMDFKRWRIDLVFGTFVYGNGEGLQKMSSSKHSITNLILSLVGYIFPKYHDIVKKEVDIHS
jgi:hypothetical protein